MFDNIRADLRSHDGHWGAQGGKNVRICADAVVLCDVPDDCIAVGVPAVVKRRTVA